MNFQRPVANIWNNKLNKLSQLNQLIYRSNLLGSNLSITNFGGERGIRTLGSIATTHAFQAGAFNHSATSPEF